MITIPISIFIPLVILAFIGGLTTLLMVAVILNELGGKRK